MSIARSKYCTINLLKLLLLWLFAFASAPTAEAVLHERELRTFTSSDGRTLEAILDHYNTSNKLVTLRLPNGQKSKLQLDRFSKEDQKYILDWRSDYDASFVKINFFGNRIKGGRIIFMLDSSGSMRGDRWEKLAANMSGVLRQLNDTAEFNIIVFGSSARAFKPDLVNASDEGAQSLEALAETFNGSHVNR